MKKCSTIMAIIVGKRSEFAGEVNRLLTEFGCHIRVRLGLHEAAFDECSDEGLILLQLCTDGAKVEELAGRLEAVPSVRVRHMSLDA